MNAARKFDRKGTRRDPAVWDALVNSKFESHGFPLPHSSLSDKWASRKGRGFCGLALL